MTKEEFERIQKETRVSSVIASTGDPLRDLLEEIYYEGYKDGYNHLKGVIAGHEPRIFGCSSMEFFNENMEKIKRRVEAIRESEACADNENE